MTTACKVLHAFAAFCAAGVALAVQGQAAPVWQPIGPPGGYVLDVIADPADGRVALAVATDLRVIETTDAGRTWTTVGASPCDPSVTHGTWDRGTVYVLCNGIHRSTDRGRSWTRFSLIQNFLGTPGYKRVAFHPAMPDVALAVGYQRLDLTVSAGRYWQNLDLAGMVGAALDVTNPQIRVVAVTSEAGEVVAYSTMDFVKWQRLATIISWGANAPSCPATDMVADRGALYAATTCGVFISIDGGFTWSARANAELQLGGDGNNLLEVEKASGRVVVLRGNAVSESTDGGRSWTVNAVPPGNFQGLAAGGGGADWVWGTTAIAHRDSSASSWTTSRPRMAATAYLQASSDGRVLLALDGSFGGLRSVDGGATWQPMSIAGGMIYDLRPIPAEPGGYLALVVADSPSYYVTHDGGATWTRSPLSLKAPDGNNIDLIAPSNAQRVYAASAIGFVDEYNFVESVPVAMLRSDDGGATWALTKLSGAPVWIKATRNPDVVYAATMQGIFRSVDGGATWAAANPFGAVTHLVVDAVSPTLIYGVAKGWMTVSADGGATWDSYPQPNLHGTTFEVLADPVDSGRVYAITDDGTAFESRDATRSWRRLSTTQWTSDYPRFSPAAVVVRGAERSLVASAPGPIRLDFDSQTLVLDSDLWWNPNESGWGVSITQHADGQVFAAWYEYDAAGNPQWQVVPGGSWIDARTFRGSVYRTRGPAYFVGNGFDPRAVSAAAVGEATLHFDSDGAATLESTVDGTTLRTSIVRQLFGPSSVALTRSIADLWWNPWESGWGIAISHQGDNVFAAWYVYDASGQPVWVVSPDARYNPQAERWQGTLYTTHGMSLAGFDPAKVQVTRVGTMALHVLGVSDAFLEYEAFGRSEARYIHRQAF
jgi:photosystem II stability/assembly factor-like uncharacterized protein